VIATNKGAIRLGKKHGFQVMGAVPEAFRHPRLGTYTDQSRAGNVVSSVLSIGTELYEGSGQLESVRSEEPRKQDRRNGGQCTMARHNPAA
jgi:hypothetical protein